MKSEVENKKWLERAKILSKQGLVFLSKTFSDKKNIVRFGFAAVAVIITAQLMPGISIASFWVAFLLVLLMVALLIAARPALEGMKLPYHIVSFGIFLCVSNWALLMFLDWLLWYFETETIWWVLLYSAIQAVFNALIESLIMEE